MIKVSGFQIRTNSIHPISSSGQLPLDDNTSGSLNNIAVLSTGGYIKTSRQALRNDNYGGSGRSSRSSSIAESDPSGSMNSIPGSIASSDASGR